MVPLSISETLRSACRLHPSPFVSMPVCPRCQQTVTRQAITCPRCQNLLKAHGHPGMTLHQATGQEPLCLTCLYHADDSCNFPKRPEAMDCTLYSNAKAIAPTAPTYSKGFLIKGWIRRHMGLIALVGLLVLSAIVVLMRS